MVSPELNGVPGTHFPYQEIGRVRHRMIGDNLKPEPPTICYQDPRGLALFHE